MGFTEHTYDLKKLARALNKCADYSKTAEKFNELTYRDLQPQLQQAYKEILRENEVTIIVLDFRSFDYDDINDLEYMLENSSANEIFRLCEVFVSIPPSATAQRAFI